MNPIPLISSILIFSGIILYVSLLLLAFLKRGKVNRVQNIQENIVAPLSFKGVPENQFTSSGSAEVASTGFVAGTVQTTAQSILTILSKLETISLDELIATLNDRSKNYVTDALKNLENEGLIEINAGIVMLTDKAAKHLLSLSEKRFDKGV